MVWPAEPGGERIAGLVGKSIPRVEDAMLVAGRGAYVDDQRVPGTLHAAFLRSPHAHARIARIDTTNALSLAGVVGVWTAAELPRFPPLPVTAPPGTHVPYRPLLASAFVRYVGEPVAIVVAMNRHLAADAVDRIDVAYELLDPILDAEAALSPGALLVHRELGSNEAYRIDHEQGDVASAFAAASVRVRARTVHPRLAAVAIEPRGLLANPATGDGLFTVWTSTQSPFGVREWLAPFLGLDPRTLRVIAPDVGGAFGVKNGLYPEDVLVSWVAQQLHHPVKWIEERRESMLATTQGRGMILEGVLAARADGILLALRASVLGDAGAYLHRNTALPPQRAQQLLSGCYRIPAIASTVRLAFTHKVPTGPYRGAGRPEGNYLIEMLMDELAAALRLDPVELRRLNFIPPDSFPFVTASSMQYDSGNYEGALDRALTLADYASLRRKPRSVSRKLRGVGVACFVETSGAGPDAPEQASVAIDGEGLVTIGIGTSPGGQGHETILAQLASDELGATLDRIRVLHGDTEIGPQGRGTFGSRSAAVGGSAVLLASRAVRARLLEAGASLLGTPVEELIVKHNQVRVTGTNRSVSLADVARLSTEDGIAGLRATEVFRPPGLAYSFGTHVAVVEIDRETGQVKVIRYVAVDDCGRAINPRIVEGQVRGGVAQGIGEALYEEMVFDHSGQPLSATLTDYGVPTSAEIPGIEAGRTETPSPLNPLGVKGVGEAGTIGAPIAITSAVRDALRPLGVPPLDPPFYPEKVWRALQAARVAKGAKTPGIPPPVRD